LVLRDSRPPIELLDTTPNLRPDRFLVLQQPAILLLLRFKKVEQCFLHIARTGRLNLFLDSGPRAASWISMFIGGPLPVMPLSYWSVLENAKIKDLHDSDGGDKDARPTVPGSISFRIKRGVSMRSRFAR
jgi:hypothetical protein